MTNRLTPGPEARARVQQRSQKELQAFFDEIPAPAMRPLAPYLPPVDGFRRGSPAGIIKQKTALAQRLSRPTATKKDFDALYMIWRAWIDETQTNAPLIQTLIEELEEAADKADGPAARGLVIEHHTDSLLQKLKEESEQNRSTREGMERLFTLSPLPETAAARSIIAAAKMATDVARDLTYRNLPTRLEEDEREIQSIKAEFKLLANRVTAIADECAKAVRDLPDLRDAIQEVRASTNAALAAVIEKANKREDDNESGRAAAEARIKTLADDFYALRESVGELTSKLDPLKHLAEVVQEFENTLEKWAEEQKEHASRIDQVGAGLEQVKRDVDAFLIGRTPTDGITPLVEQIAKLARRVDAIATQFQTSHQIPSSAPYVANISSPLRWTSLPMAGNAVAISSCTGLVTALCDAVLPLGMRKSGAQLLAEECAAAIAAQQAVFLQGAFASRVARAFAAATGGGLSARFAMPIGVLDGGQIQLAVEQAFASLDDGVGALAIEGINLVPFDLIREIIADCTSPAAQPNAPYRRIAVFATLSPGVASLPIEPEVLELGPVFDLDYFDWRTNPIPVPLSRGSFLPTKTDQAIIALLASAQPNMDEVLHLAKAPAHKRNPAVERSVVRAYQALHLTRSDQNTVTPLHSIVYGWLLPYWRALGLSREQIDSAFDGRTINGVPLDDRLTRMFAAEFPDSKQGRGP